jgi:hypothetical protein
MFALGQSLPAASCPEADALNDGAGGKAALLTAAGWIRFATTMPSITDPSEQRRLFALSFEPDGDQFVFFRNRWASGVPVTADEREAYLSAGIFDAGRRREFVRKVRDRAPIRPPRRTDGGLRRQMLRSFPPFTIVVYLTFGLLAFSFAADQRVWLWQWLLVPGGLLSVGMAGAIVAAKLVRHR